MTDAPSNVPATPPAAPAAAPVAPAAPETVDVTQQDLKVQDIAKKGLQQWIYEEFGGDDVWLNYIAEHPEGVQNAVSLFGVKESQINTREALQSLNVTWKIGLLIYAEFKGSGKKSTEKEKTEGLTLAEQLKDKGPTLTFADYKAYWQAKGGAEAPLFLDTSPHSIWKGPALFDWVKIATAMGTKGADLNKEWPRLFPYPAGSRVVLDKTNADLEKIVSAGEAKIIMENTGIKLVTVPAGQVPPKPADNEVQLVSMQDPEPMTWDKVKESAKLWEDSTVPTQFEGAPKTLAAIQALDEKGPVYSTPEDLCKQVGYANPAPEFLKFLETAHSQTNS
jgi:hypothetical protein